MDAEGWKRLALKLATKALAHNDDVRSGSAGRRISRLEMVETACDVIRVAGETERHSGPVDIVVNITDAAALQAFVRAATDAKPEVDV